MGKSRLVIFVLAGVFLFNACAEEVTRATRPTPVEPTPAGGGRDFREEFEDIDPCSLLTAEEAGDALGETVGRGERNKLICVWNPTDNEEGAAMMLRVHGEGRNPRGICAAHVDRGEQVSVPPALDAGYSEAEGLALFTQGVDHACVIINTLPAGELELSDFKQLAALVLARPPFNGEDEDEEEEEEERRREEDDQA